VVLSLAGGMPGWSWLFGASTRRESSSKPEPAASNPGYRAHSRLGKNTPVLTFSLGLSLVTGLFFGVFRALQLSKGGLNHSLKEGGRSTTLGLTGSRLRGILVISEVAIALVLLIGAGLLMRSFLRLEAIDPGFSTDHVLTMTVSVAGNPKYTGERREALCGQIVDQIKALPGVEFAGMVKHIPLGGDPWGRGFSIEGQPVPRPGRRTARCLPGFPSGLFSQHEDPSARRTRLHKPRHRWRSARGYRE